MYTEISAAIQSAKSLAELLKAAKSLANYNELAAAVSEVNSKLMEATAVALKSQERHAELLGRVNELEHELAEIKRVHDQSKNYTLHKFETGALAYVLEEEVAGTPQHYICAKCADSGTHSKLQPAGNCYLQCHTCSAKIQHKFASPPVAARRVSSGFTRDW